MGWALAASMALLLFCYAVSGFQIYHALSHFDVPLAVAREVNRWAPL